MLKKTEVVIIGGGVAGLAAAQELLTSKLDINVVVLEARNRLGGRVETARMKNGDVIELGANWIHGYSKNNKMYPFTVPDEQGHVALKISPYSYNFIKVFRNGKHYPLKLLGTIFNDMARVRDELHQDPKKLEKIKNLHDERDYIKKALSKSYPQVDMEYLCDIWRMKESEGADPAMEAVYVPLFNHDKSKSVEYIHPEGRDYLVVNGMNNFIQKLKKNVKAVLSAKVIKVQQLKRGVTVSYIKDNQIEKINADYVINTIPWGALKTKDIKYTPALSKAKAKALEKVEMTQVMKVALSFNKHAFMSAIRQARHPLVENILAIDSHENGLGNVFALNLNALSYFGKSTMCKAAAKIVSWVSKYDAAFLEQYFYSKMFSYIKPPVSSPTILFFLSDAQVVGKLSEMNEKAIVKLCIEALKKYYPSLTITSITDSKITAWTQDSLCSGAYPYLGCKMGYDDIDALASREGNMLFAGDGLGIEHDKCQEGHIKIQHSSLHAAITSGHNAAQEIIGEIRSN
jgi:monoamine oxidase